MRVVVFTSKDHILANKIIKELFNIPEIKITAISESSIVYPGKSNVGAVLSILKKSGASYTTAQVAKFLHFRIASLLYKFFPFKNPKQSLFSYHRFALKNNIPIFIENNINSKSFLRKMSILKPDLFVSIFLNQIFKKELLSVPKKGTINIHPAFLPSYRGLSPTFWVLANGEKETGISIHEVSESIDNGAILAQQKVAILPSDTEYSLYARCVKIGIPLLKKIISNLAKNRNIKKVSQKEAASSYYSLPTKSAVKGFRKNGRKFFSVSELLLTKIS